MQMQQQYTCTLTEHSLGGGADNHTSWYLWRSAGVNDMNSDKFTSCVTNGKLKNFYAATVDVKQELKRSCY